MRDLGVVAVCFPVSVFSKFYQTAYNTGELRENNFFHEQNLMWQFSAILFLHYAVKL